MGHRQKLCLTRLISSNDTQQLSLVRSTAEPGTVSGLKARPPRVVFLHNLFGTDLCWWLASCSQGKIRIRGGKPTFGNLITIKMYYHLLVLGCVGDYPLVRRGKYQHNKNKKEIKRGEKPLELQEESRFITIIFSLSLSFVCTISGL